MADYTDSAELSIDLPLQGQIDSLYAGRVLAAAAAADITPPTINSFTPSAGTIDPSQSIVIEMGDDEELNTGRKVFVFASYPLLGLIELAYDGSAFVGDYTGSEIQTSAPPAELVELTISRTGGWYASPLHLIVYVFDEAGNQATDTEIYTVSPDPTVLPDSTAPVVLNYSPAPGSTISTGDSIAFDVTDNSGSFTRIMVVAWYRATGVQEVIHDGDGFTGYFNSTSSRVIISGGYRYTVARFGGWEHSPTIRVFPIDAAGNEA